MRTRKGRDVCATIDGGVIALYHLLGAMLSGYYAAAGIVPIFFLFFVAGLIKWYVCVISSNGIVMFFIMSLVWKVAVK